MENIAKKLPIYNITRNTAKSLGLLLLITILGFSLFLTAYLSFSMKNGLASVKDKLGADMIITPKKMEAQIEGAILNGTPSSFYLNTEVLTIIQNIKGIEKASPQMFVATLSAGCCAFPVQVIGIDFSTDFSVTPWIKEFIELPLKENEVLVGNNIYADPNTKIPFFEYNFFIKDRLQKTGMGFDNCVFMSFDDAVKLARRSKNYGVDIPLQNTNLYSCIMIKIKDGYNITSVYVDINKALRKTNARAYLSAQIYTDTQQKIEKSYTYIYILLGIIWTMCLIVLIIVFPLTIKSRSGELMALRIIGMEKKALSCLILKESFILGITGAVAGTFFSIVIAILFNTHFRNILQLPFLRPSMFVIFLLLVMCILLVSMTGPISSLFVLYKLNKKEIAIASKENQ